MRRREVIASIGGIIAWSPTVLAQRGSKQPRIAFVHSGIPAADLTESAGPFWVRRFLQELRRLGHVEGENLILRRYSADGHQERFGALAREVVTSKPDLIVMNYNALARAFQDVTSTVPLAWDRCRPGPNRTCREPCGPWWQFHRRQRRRWSGDTRKAPSAPQGVAPLGPAGCVCWSARGVEWPRRTRIAHRRRASRAHCFRRLVGGSRSARVAPACSTRRFRNAPMQRS